MNELIRKVLLNCSPAEIALIERGDLSVARWIAEKVFDVTPTQADSIALRVYETLKG